LKERDDARKAVTDLETKLKEAPKMEIEEPKSKLPTKLLNKI